MNLETRICATVPMAGVLVTGNVANAWPTTGLPMNCQPAILPKKRNALITAVSGTLWRDENSVRPPLNVLVYVGHI